MDEFISGVEDCLNEFGVLQAFQVTCFDVPACLEFEDTRY
jgi:hypothetical protein